MDEKTLYCRECGEEMFLDDHEVSHHTGDTHDDINYEADADHVAVSDVEE